jgi:hypothetical protein
MSHDEATKQKRPLGLVLLSVLLLILALRAVGWIIIGGILRGYLPGPAQWVLGLVVGAILLASAIGLLRLWAWARWLALVVCSVYFGLTLVNVAVLWPQLRTSQVSLRLGVLNAAEAILVLFMAWWYLNRKEVRQIFQKRPQNRG